MIYTEAEVFSFIFKATQFAIESKWRVFCSDTTIDNLECAYRQYKKYDEAITFYNALHEWLKVGIINSDHAFNAAFKRSQYVLAF